MKKILLFYIGVLSLLGCTKDEIKDIPSISSEIAVETITSRVAIVKGTILKSGSDSVFSRGIVYGTNPNPTIADNKITDGKGSGTFTKVISDLLPDKTYYAKTFTTSKYGTNYSKGITIKTPSFDFNWLDDNGKPILSKNSEYIILVPDIQNYISSVANNKYLESSINWILQFNDFGFKVKTVLQVGDVTNANSVYEWTIAQKLFAKLENNIECIMCTGNHDYGDNGTTNNRITRFSEYFKYVNNTSYISSFEMNNYENSYFKIKLHDQPFTILSLEFAPRDKVLKWADNILKENSSSIGLLLTHAYLSPPDRFNFAKYKYSQSLTPYGYTTTNSTFGIEKINDGEEIWQKLIDPNPNLQFVFCGHNLIPKNDGYLISKNKENKNVLQMVFNKQDSPNGGDGWIKIIEFEKNQKVNIRAYSTSLKQWENNTKTIEFPF